MYDVLGRDEVSEVEILAIRPEPRRQKRFTLRDLEVRTIFLMTLSSTVID